MNNKTGFSFISFLLYLVLFSTIALFISNIITSLLLPTLSATRINKSLIGLHVASDLFVKDIRAMRVKNYVWKKTTPYELIWHSDNYDTGWTFNKNRLERHEGIYSNNNWQKRKVSVVATHIKQATFTLDIHNKSIVGVEMTLIADLCPQSPVVSYGAVNQSK